MDEIYQRHGIRFKFPAHWELTEEEGDQSTCITVDSPETSSWSVSLFFDHPTPRQVIESAVQAFREEYDEVDVYPAEDTLGNPPGLAMDVDFVCFELINSAFLRSFLTERFTVLVLYQGFDGELQTTRPLLELIGASLKLDEADTPE